MQKRVFFYVQHLWGVGHVYRATRIAHGLKRAGFDVHLIWGGTRLPGFDFNGLSVHYLTPVRTSDASFSQLLHADGEPFSDEDKNGRKTELLSLFDEIMPDVLITEAFPFGRRQMRFELLPLLEHARNSECKPLIVASIRDIMQENRKAERVAESNSYVRSYFDLVMVHGDPELITIEETLQGTENFQGKIRYTGLVTPDPIETTNQPKEICVLISVGGGAFGKNLLVTALQAFEFCKSSRGNWIVTTGTEIANESFEEIRSNAPPGLKVVRHITDMVSMLARTKVSVSHAGYNTVGDILRAGCHSILYPYTGGRETEQLRRAQMMDQLGIARMIAPEEFSPQSLAAAIDEVALRQPAVAHLNLDGVDGTAAVLREFLNNLPSP